MLVNMWASWCTPCKYEMPAIQEAYEEFRDQGFTVLAVNLTKKDVLGSVESFVEEHGLTFPILLDQDGRVEDAYQLRGLPTSFFIDRDGVIQSVVIGGPMSQEAIRSFVQKLIDEE
jgi:thiol-disulfide isomerase/thioredoxin